MKYISMGTPDFEVYVPEKPFPVIAGTHDFTTGEQGQSVALHSVLYYPERSYASPLQPREATIREDGKLTCVLIIRPGQQPDTLEVSTLISAKGTLLSATMPAGSGPAQQVARAIMTVFPVSALTTQELANVELNRQLDEHREIEEGTLAPEARIWNDD